MKTLLVILFMMNGQPTINGNGYAPFFVFPEENCEQAAARAESYIEETLPEMPDGATNVVAGCTRNPMEDEEGYGADLEPLVERLLTKEMGPAL